MNFPIGRSAALLLAGSLLLVGMPGSTRAQRPAGAGTQSEREATLPGSDPHSTPSPSRPPSPAAAQPAALASATVPGAAATPTLADLAWLVGSWQGVWGPRIAQQFWTAPTAGVMLGSFQLVENHKTLVIELFALTETPGGIELRIRHFTPSLVPWEKGGPAVLHLTGDDAKSATFENSANGEPKTQSFRRIDADSYSSRSEVVPPEGDPQIAEIYFHRVRAEVAPQKRKPAKPSK